jgi:hypothetical protein
MTEFDSYIYVEPQQDASKQGYTPSFLYDRFTDPSSLERWPWRPFFSDINKWSHGYDPFFGKKCILIF